MLQNKQVVVLRMAFRARKVLGTFEKRLPGLEQAFSSFDSSYMLVFVEVRYCADRTECVILRSIILRIILGPNETICNLEGTGVLNWKGWQRVRNKDIVNTEHVIWRRDPHTCWRHLIVSYVHLKNFRCVQRDSSQWPLISQPHFINISSLIIPITGSHEPNKLTAHIWMASLLCWLEHCIGMVKVMGSNPA